MTADHTRKAGASDSGSASTAKTARKSRAKKSAAEKTPSKETAAKKAPTANTQADTPDGSDQTPRRRASAPKAESRPRRSALEVAARAVEQLTALTGRAAEGVTGIESNDDGWRVTVEVLEVRRIPETTDVMARYEIDTDDNGDLTGYRRAGRYTRGSARED